MSIEYYKINGSIIEKQKASKPIVYLDNWAVNKFSQDEELKKTLINLIIKKNGTVAFSILNLYEILRREDKSQKKSIIEFISNFNDIFIDSDPLRVIRREEESNNIGAGFNIENAFLSCDRFIKILISSGYKSNTFKVSDILRYMNDEINELKIQLSNDYTDGLSTIIDNGRKVESILKNAKIQSKKKIMKKEICKPYTRELNSYSVQYIASNQFMKMSLSEWIDLYHTIVPVAYCDFVLIDKRWVQFINTTDLHYPDIANVYKEDGIENFLHDLESFQTKTNTFDI